MKDTLKINSQQKTNLITPKQALHQCSWQIIAERFDLDDISTTRSLLAEAHKIILEQDMIVESQDILIEKLDINNNGATK